MPDLRGDAGHHCGRNPALADPRRGVICETEFLPRHPRKRYCSMPCVGQGNAEAFRGRPEPARRKVERPPYAVLLREVEELGWSAVGRRYGVSDDAMRR